MARTPDVVIVGAGLMGSCIAYRLASQGLRVLLLDRGSPGDEASGAAAGILTPQSEAVAPGPAYDLAAASYALFPALADELRELTGVDIGLRRTGCLELAFTDERAQELAKRFAWQPARGLTVERLDARGVRALVPAVAGSVLGAFHFPAEGQVDPRALMDALVSGATRRGAELRRGAEVRRIVCDGDAVRGVDLLGETIAAPAVVVCAGAWSSGIADVGLAPRAVRPVRGQMVELELSPSPTDTLLASARGYVVPRSRGRLLCGSTVEDVGFDKAVTVEGVSSILDMAREMLPALGAARVTATWSGLRPGTDDGRPHIGAGSVRGLFHATGHFRTGVLLTPITARIVSDLVVGRSIDR